MAWTGAIRTQSRDVAAPGLVAKPSEAICWVIPTSPVVGAAFRTSPTPGQHDRYGSMRAAERHKRLTVLSDRADEIDRP